LHFSRNVTRPHAAGVLLFAGVFWLPAAADAQARMEFIPSLSVFTVFDDNIYARVNSTAGQMFQLRPSAEGSYESPKLRLLGVYSFDMQRSNFSSLNTLDARRHALGEARLRTSPYTTIGLAFRYDRSETPGELNADTGVLGPRALAERLEVTPTYARRLDPRTSLTAAYGWTTERLVDGERILVGGDHGRLQVGRATVSRQATIRTTLSLGYVGRYFVDHIADHSSHALLAGWTRELAPATRLTVFAGPRFSSYRGLEPETSAAFERTTTRVRLSIDYWHGETIILGVPGPVRADGVTLRSAWPLTPRLELSAHAGVSDVTTLDDRDSTVYRATLGASWSPGGLYSIGAAYGADYQDGTIRNRISLDDGLIRFDDQILRHVLRVSVTVAPRYSRSILPPDEAARAKGVTR
jgi:hypothetical protein